MKLIRVTISVIEITTRRIKFTVCSLNTEKEIAIMYVLANKSVYLPNKLLLKTCYFVY